MRCVLPEPALPVTKILEGRIVFLNGRGASTVPRSQVEHQSQSIIKLSQVGRGELPDVVTQPIAI